MNRKLTEDEFEEVNTIIKRLQNDLDGVIDNTKKMQFNEALKDIITAMGHTECSLCKQKLAILSSKVIEAKIACKNKDSHCELIIKEAVEKGKSIKDDFIPIATEKRYKKSIVERIDTTTTTEPKPEIPDIVGQLLTLPIRLPKIVIDNFSGREKPKH